MGFLHTAKWYLRDIIELRNILRLKKELIRNQKLPHEGLKNLQDQKFRDVLKYAMAHSPFYREFYKGIDPERCSIEDLPILTKRIMMDNYDSLVTDPRLNLKDLEEFLSDRANAAMPFKDDFVILNSSGTSGEMGIMAYHWGEFDYAYATGMARGNSFPTSLLSLFGYIIGERLRVANIMMTNGHAASFITCYRISMNPNNPIMDNRFFSVFKPIDELCDELNKFQPHILQAYSTVITNLAYEQLAGRLKLRFDDPRSVIASLSEPLSSKTRELCKEAFGRDVIDDYGACESILMARECEMHRGMHINSDLVILEVVDENYQPVPPGTTGNKILVTNLYTYVQPIIRYELQDRVCMEPESCTCGSTLPLIRSVEGRTDEIVWISKPGGGYEPIHPYIFFVPTLNNPGIKEYQAEQIERDKVIFRIVPVEPGSMTDDDVTRMVEKSLEEEGLGGRMKIEGKAVDSIQRDPVSGKILQVISRVGPPEGVRE
ncbi:MAG: phenylacetate--CoA ligase family protein [Deltaproteobacteria bacterium]|nr:phenylacetate--CoA ligase family protein [Deltaproteobacteria bacterium]